MVLYFQTALSCLGFFLNASMTVIICITKSDSIAKYKYLLLLYTASSAMLCYSPALSAGTMFVNGHTWIYYDSFNILPFVPAQLFLVQFCVGFLQVFIILLLSFLYRYFIVCRYVNSSCFPSIYSIKREPCLCVCI